MRYAKALLAYAKARGKADQVCLEMKRLSDSFISLVLDTQVDPKLIGGFILQIGDRRLDASVATQLKSFEQQFIAKNRRIV